MRVLLVALLLVPVGAWAQSSRDWDLCKAVDADQPALAACTRLIQANTFAGHDLAVAYFLRGKVDWQLRELDAAIADDDKAIEIDPDFADAYAARSAADLSKEDDDQAIADASKAIELDPRNAVAYGNRGLARAHKKKGKDLDGAIADVTRAVEIDPNNVQSYLSRGSIYKQAREPGRAYADFGKATEIEPRSGFFGYRLRGIAFQLRGDYGHAIADYNRWIDIDPGCAYAYTKRADAYKEKGTSSTPLPMPARRSRSIHDRPTAIVSKAGSTRSRMTRSTRLRKRRPGSRSNPGAVAPTRREAMRTCPITNTTAGSPI